ncbi:MAG: hypothetical protein MST11_10830 [Spirochaetia bacterium]|nr:hypothetical protein [Spirochaetia bacterium]
MKHEKEKEEILALCSHVKDMLDIVFPHTSNIVSYEDQTELITVFVGDKMRIINVQMDSTKAALVDIANQFLCKL